MDSVAKDVNRCGKFHKNPLEHAFGYGAVFWDGATCWKGAAADTCATPPPDLLLKGPKKRVQRNSPFFIKRALMSMRPLCFTIGTPNMFSLNLRFKKLLNLLGESHNLSWTFYELSIPLQ